MIRGSQMQQMRRGNFRFCRLTAKTHQFIGIYATTRSNQAARIYFLQKPVVMQVFIMIEHDFLVKMSNILLGWTGYAAEDFIDLQSILVMTFMND
jgi:hypothetical protein